MDWLREMSYRCLQILNLALHSLETVFNCDLFKQTKTKSSDVTVTKSTLGCNACTGETQWSKQ